LTSSTEAEEKETEMTQFWGPAVEAEVKYRHAKLARIAGSSGGGQRRGRKARRVREQTSSTAAVARARPA
jgi:hypothetical protein